MIHPQKKALNAARFSIIANLALAIVKGIAGFFGNSFALIADAIESTTDVFSSMLVWWGIRLSAKPADDNHPYGHGKIEPLITFVVVGFLLVSATIIVVESIHNIRTPHAAPAPFTLIVLGVIMVSKEIFYRFVHQKGVETESSSLRADAWHHRSDALTSLMAFIGISIALLMGEGYESADDWAAIFAAGFIAFNAYLIFRPALGEIMDEHLHDDLEAQIRRIAQKIEGVEGTEKCHIRKSGMVYHIDLHLIVNGDLSVREGHEIAHRLKDAIREALPNVADVLIHVEPDTP
ncbi:MAG: cation transporter [Bacteroidetes bacterium]|nr:MAG: cation transporter [Bacteroidota bacterium]